MAEYYANLKNKFGPEFRPLGTALSARRFLKLFGYQELTFNTGIYQQESFFDLFTGVVLIRYISHLYVDVDDLSKKVKKFKTNIFLSVYPGVKNQFLFPKKFKKKTSC